MDRDDHERLFQQSLAVLRPLYARDRHRMAKDLRVNQDEGIHAAAAWTASGKRVRQFVAGYIVETDFGPVWFHLDPSVPPGTVVSGTPA